MDIMQIAFDKLVMSHCSSMHKLTHKIDTIGKAWSNEGKIL